MLKWPRSLRITTCHCKSKAPPLLHSHAPRPEGTAVIILFASCITQAIIGFFPQSWVIARLSERCPSLKLPSARKTLCPWDRQRCLRWQWNDTLLQGWTCSIPASHLMMHFHLQNGKASCTETLVFASVHSQWSPNVFSPIRWWDCALHSLPLWDLFACLAKNLFNFLQCSRSQRRAELGATFE